MTTHVPQWMDVTRLSKEISVSPATIEDWSRRGILPQGRERGGKLLWYWPEVHESLLNGRHAERSPNERLRDEVKAALARL